MQEFTIDLPRDKSYLFAAIIPLSLRLFPLRGTIKAQKQNIMPSGGVVSPENTSDHEEKEQCIKMHEIIGEHNLEGEFRWVQCGSSRTLCDPDITSQRPSEFFFILLHTYSVWSRKMLL